ncbi:hypothetical protein BJ742DRAFT_806933 [Cladochytrium replicatum]|nr:hypothetical protein BJ742DRAFT_806933 [Cladochytrium replicatum]
MSTEFCWSAQSSGECTSFFTTCVWCGSFPPGCFKQTCPTGCSPQDVDEGNCYRFAPSTSECVLRRCSSALAPGNVDCTNLGAQPGVRDIVCGPDCLNQFSAQSCQTFTLADTDNTTALSVSNTVPAATAASTLSAALPLSSLSASGTGSSISQIAASKSSSSNVINPVAPTTSSIAKAPELNASNLTRNILLIVVGTALVAVLIAIIVLGERRRRRQAAARKAAREGRDHLPITREIDNTRGPPSSRVYVAKDQSYLNFRTLAASSWNRFVGRFARPGATPSPAPTVNTSSPPTSEAQPLIGTPSITADPPVRPTVIATAERRQIQAEHQRIRDSMRDIPPNRSPEDEQTHVAEDGSPIRRPTYRTLDSLRRKQTMNSESASDSMGSTPETTGGSIDLRGRLPNVSARSENYSDTP